MPFCGYCGRPLAYGENCGCPESLQKNSGESEGMHDYSCRYCGAEVKAGETCTCAQAQFEARYVKNRPAQPISQPTPPRQDIIQAPAPMQRPMYPPPQQNLYGQGQPYGQNQQYKQPYDQGQPYGQSQQYGQPYGQPYNQQGSSWNPPYGGQQYPQRGYVPSTYTPPVKKTGKGLLLIATYVLAVIIAAGLFYVSSNSFSGSKDSSSRKKSSAVQDTTAYSQEASVKESPSAAATEPEAPSFTPPSGKLPESFSLVEEGYVTSTVNDQGDHGACFAFSWIGAVENRLLAQGDYSDLSEWAYYKSFQEYYYNANRTNDIASAANLHSAFVPENKAPYPYYDDEYEVDVDIEKDSNYIVSDVYLLTTNENEDTDAISSRAKTFLRNGYALICSVYYDDGELDYTDDFNGTWYVSEDVNSLHKALNHSVLVVGWDDNYSKDNFLHTPPGDGAWLVKNSWGIFSGDMGYYWISYYDKMFPYSELAAIDITDSFICDGVQSYWSYGWDYSYYNSHSNTAINGDPMDKVYQACTYKAEQDMDVTAVSFFSVCDEMKYTVYVAAESEGDDSFSSPGAKGVQNSKGYHLVELNEPKHVKKGEEYTIIILMESPEKDYLIVQDSEYAYDKQRAVSADAGMFYVSADGKEWFDVKSYSLKNDEGESSIMPLCISAYYK